MRILVALLLAGLLTGCQAYMNSSAPALRLAVEVEDDPFETSITVLGIEEHLGDNLRHSYFLRSWIDRDTKSVSHQLYVSYSYRGEWRFFRSASDATAQSFRFVEIDRDVSCSGGCTFYEDFGIMIPDEKLRAAAEEGLHLKAFAKSGHELMVHVTRRQIAAQLEAVEGRLAAAP